MNSGKDWSAVQLEATTIPQWLDALAARHREKPCVIGDQHTLSYAELNLASAAIARGLLARGVSKGSRIGLLMGNGPHWVMWWAAVCRIGAVCVPLSTFLQAAELARTSRHADLHWLVATDRFLSRDFTALLADAFDDLADQHGRHLALTGAPFLRAIVLAGRQTTWSYGPDWVIDAGRDHRWGDVLVHAEREVHPDDDALCIYTSGQSADPKGVVHSQRTVVGKAHYLREMLGFQPDSVAAATMPFFWVGGLVMALFPAMDAGAATQCAERSTWATGAVIGHTPAGSAEAATHTRDFARIPALGMTETFGMYSWAFDPVVPEYPIAAPIDELQPGFELRLADEDGRDTAEGSVGEILLRGPTVATRLHKVDRSIAYDNDGFYRTGDLGVRHGNRVSFVGRKHDMIKTSGANVSPAEVERELATFDEVQAAFVVGLDDAQRGQVVAAAVLLAPGATLSVNNIQARLRERLSSYKIPRIVVALDSAEDIPMTPSLKVRKRELAALIQVRIARPDVSTPGVLTDRNRSKR